MRGIHVGLKTCYTGFLRFILFHVYFVFDFVIIETNREKPVLFLLKYFWKKYKVTQKIQNELFTIFVINPRIYKRPRMYTFIKYNYWNSNFWMSSTDFKWWKVFDCYRNFCENFWKVENFWRYFVLGKYFVLITVIISVYIGIDNIDYLINIL